jgi:hypothetical protein
LKVARLAVYSICAGLAATAFATSAGWLDAAHPRLSVAFALGALLGAVAALLVARALAAAPPVGLRRALRIVDWAAFNAVALLLLAEVALRILQWAQPSQLLWDESDGMSSVLAQRICWEEEAFHYRCNSRGYVDEEFFDPGPRDYVAAFVGDSFGVGVVPWTHNFVTLAEQELRAHLAERYERVAIHNFSVSGVDLPGYRYLLETEIVGQPFQQVVLAIFVGNDLGDLVAERGGARRLLHLDGWLGPEVVRRLAMVVRGVGWSPMRGVMPAEVPAFLSDPSLEKPTFSEEAFFQIELERMRYTLKRGRASELVYRRALDQLDAFHEALGSRLVLMLIPDEYQVNDELWSKLLPAAARSYARARAPAGAHRAFERDHPQRLLRAWAESRGVPVVDPLPALREAQRSARTYHLRDTHWNAHGNRVAAGVLADALIERAGE